MIRYFLANVVIAVLMFAGVTASSQTTGGVFGPVVNSGHESIQYRAAFNPDTDAFAQRFHYQNALNDDLMFRIVGQTSRSATSDFEPDFLQGELFWQLTDNDNAWQSGLRFDATIRDGGRPESVGLHWMNQWRITPQIQSRFILLSGVQFGDGAADGILIGSRALLSYRPENAPLLSVELYSSYGSTDNFRNFEDQSHQFGPAVTFSFEGGWSIYTNALFGLTDASSDTELRVFVGRSF